jgi:hypothetical protein
MKNQAHIKLPPDRFDLHYRSKLIRLATDEDECDGWLGVIPVFIRMDEPDAPTAQETEDLGLPGLPPVTLDEVEDIFGKQEQPPVVKPFGEKD